NISFSGGKSAGLKSLNVQIVCDADRLDALGAIGIIRTIEYGASKGRPFYNEENLKCGRQGVLQEDLPNTSLSHFYEKLLKLEGLMFTRFGKELAKQRTQFMFQFLQQFYDELGN
ncbi:MAG: phosphohydrolase, partial [Paludibacteraceae bacterium]|nr:phosphohydrolase [Paludibacteraceae bacterium]